MHAYMWCVHTRVCRFPVLLSNVTGAAWNGAEGPTTGALSTGHKNITVQWTGLSPGETSVPVTCA